MAEKEGNQVQKRNVSGSKIYPFFQALLRTWRPWKEHTELQRLPYELVCNPWGTEMEKNLGL